MVVQGHAQMKKKLRRFGWVNLDGKMRETDLTYVHVACQCSLKTKNMVNMTYQAYASNWELCTIVEKLFRGEKIRNQAAADTVDGRNPANQLIHIYIYILVYPIIYRTLYTSQVVVWEFFHQQYGT